MKIYFAGSIRGGRDDAELYRQIIQLLSKYGTVLTEHVADSQLTEWGEKDRGEAEIYERDMKWLSEADVVVAEVTTPSLGVGYELAKAEELGKRILCLYRPQKDRRLSPMITGNSRTPVTEYGAPDDLTGIFRDFFGSS